MRRVVELPIPESDMIRWLAAAGNDIEDIKQIMPKTNKTTIGMALYWGRRRRGNKKK